MLGNTGSADCLEHTGGASGGRGEVLSDGDKTNSSVYKL